MNLISRLAVAEIEGKYWAIQPEALSMICRLLASDPPRVVSELEADGEGLQQGQSLALLQNELHAG